MTTKATSREEDIILGTILGDGHIAMLKGDARLEIGHSDKQKQYVFWKYDELKRFISSKPYRSTILDKRVNKTYIRWSFKTKTNKLFTNFREYFYPDGKK